MPVWLGGIPVPLAEMRIKEREFIKEGEVEFTLGSA